MRCKNWTIFSDKQHGHVPLLHERNIPRQTLSDCTFALSQPFVEVFAMWSSCEPWLLSSRLNISCIFATHGKEQSSQAGAEFIATHETRLRNEASLLNMFCRASMAITETCLPGYVTCSSEREESTFCPPPFTAMACDWIPCPVAEVNSPYVRPLRSPP